MKFKKGDYIINKNSKELYLVGIDPTDEFFKDREFKYYVLANSKLIYTQVSIKDVENNYFKISKNVVKILYKPIKRLFI